MGLAEVLRVRIYGLPIAQGRPRAFRMPGTGRIRMYDPATSRDWKRTVTAQVLEVRPATPVDGPLTLWLRFYLPRPRTLPKKVRHHTKRPDLDNIVKAVKDALRGIVYRDDAQIIELLARKQYGVPGVDILVERVLHEAAAEVTNLESLGGGRGEWRD